MLTKIKNLKRFWNILSDRERIWFAIFVVFVLFSASFLIGSFYRSKTITVPAFGGTYIEAVSESPHNINPILSTNDADRDLSKLIFSSLLEYNPIGELAPGLAASYAVSKDGKTYTIKLKDGIKWHDGKPFTSNDVIFTINAVQNPEYNSPLRTSWQGVKAEAPDKSTVVITLKTPYAAFTENLAMLGILPEHIWIKVLPQNFPLADFNLKPVGTGPYRFVKLQKDSLGKIISINLAAYSGYHNGSPMIENIMLKFYSSEEEAVSAYNRKEANGILLQTAQNKSQVRGLSNSQFFSLSSLRIYGLFFNTEHKLLGADYVRKALNYAVNRQEILEKLLLNEGKIAIGPIPPTLPGSSPNLNGYSYDPQKTAEILEKNKWIKNDNGFYEKKIGKDKEATPLKFTITTIKSMQLVATLIRDYLKNVDVDVDLKIIPIGELQKNFRDKSYDAILIGESYTAAADPYVFWHGAAIKEQGLNLALYNNIKANKILEDVRQIADPTKRAIKLEEFQKLVLNDAPAIFLYSPNYIYAMNSAVKNVNFGNLVIPSNRFSKVNDWYIETERTWK